MFHVIIMVRVWVGSLVVGASGWWMVHLRHQHPPAVLLGRHPGIQGFPLLWGWLTVSLIPLSWLSDMAGLGGGLVLGFIVMLEHVN